MESPLGQPIIFFFTLYSTQYCSTPSILFYFTLYYYTLPLLSITITFTVHLLYLGQIRSGDKISLLSTVDTYLSAIPHGYHMPCMDLHVGLTVH